MSFSHPFALPLSVSNSVRHRSPHAPQQNGELQVCYIEVIWQLARKMKEINVIHLILEVPRVDLKRIITKIMVITFLFVYD